MSETKSYTIRVLNDQYAIQSDEHEETVHRAAQLVDMLMHEIIEKSRLIDQKKAAVLASLRLASQLIHMENQLSELHHKEQELINAVDSLC